MRNLSMWLRILSLDFSWCQGSPPLDPDPSTMNLSLRKPSIGKHNLPYLSRLGTSVTMNWVMNPKDYNLLQFAVRLHVSGLLNSVTRTQLQHAHSIQKTPYWEAPYLGIEPRPLVPRNKRITFLHDPGFLPHRVPRWCKVFHHTPDCCVCSVARSCVTPGSSCPAVTCNTTHLPPSPPTQSHLTTIHTENPPSTVIDYNTFSISVIRNDFLIILLQDNFIDYVYLLSITQ